LGFFGKPVGVSDVYQLVMTFQVYLPLSTFKHFALLILLQISDEMRLVLVILIVPAKSLVVIGKMRIYDTQKGHL
jgi:predicted transcriptional regulator